jgi:hypothetical protein
MNLLLSVRDHDVFILHHFVFLRGSANREHDQHVNGHGMLDHPGSV